MDDLQISRDRARDRGVPDGVAEWWLGLARPRLVLDQAGEAAEESVAGYHGGGPLLPEGVDWPGLPHFVASVDCAALPTLADLPLPEDGQLLFFGNKGVIDFHPDARDTGGRVLYVPAGTATSERIAPEGELEECEREPFPIRQRRALHQSFHWNFPQPDVLDDIENAYDTYEQYGLDDLSWDFWQTGTFALGGYPTIVHDDPCGYVREDSDDDWRLLAETRNDFTDSCAGYIYWVIRGKDLTERRFDRVKTLMQGVA